MANNNQHSVKRSGTEQGSGFIGSVQAVWKEMSPRGKRAFITGTSVLALPFLASILGDVLPLTQITEQAPITKPPEIATAKPIETVVPTAMATESPSFKAIDGIRLKALDLAKKNGISVVDSKDPSINDTQRQLVDEFQISLDKTLGTDGDHIVGIDKVNITQTQIIHTESTNSPTGEKISGDFAFTTVDYTRVTPGDDGSGIHFQYRSNGGVIVNSFLMPFSKDIVEGKTVKKFKAMQQNGVQSPAVVAIYDNNTTDIPSQLYLLQPGENGGFNVLILQGDEKSIERFIGVKVNFIMSEAINISETFKDNQPFYTELIKQDKNASKDIQERGDAVTLTTADGKQYDVDKTSGGVNVDVNGNPLLVEDTGYVNPLTLHGKAGTESEGKVFAFNPDYKGWFEVIQSNHPVDQKASEAEKMVQRETAINDPVTVTVEQVQNGDWAESVLLSGLVKPFPADWKFTGNDVYHNSNEFNIGLNWTLLYTSKPIPIDVFGRVNVGGNNIRLDPWQFWNPQDLATPDHSQVMIGNVGQGQERSTPDQIKIYINNIYNNKNTPTLIVSIPDDNLSPVEEGGLVKQPSVLSLKRLSGNDPLSIFFIEHTVEIHGKKVLWQTGSQSNLDLLDIQKFIWIVFY